MSIEFKDFLSPLATLVSVAGGFAGVIWSLRATRQNQERKQAFDTYDAYLKLCFEYPRFANGQLVDQGFSVPETYKEGSDEFYRYEWFVARLLVAAEQILSAVPGDREWEETIRSQVRKHNEYVQTDFFKPKIKIYSKPVQAIIEGVISKYPTKSIRQPND